MTQPKPGNAITQLFNKFAGREVPMVESKKTRDIGGKKYTYDEVALANQNDPTIAEMNKVAHDNGLSLRVFWPGIGGTCDMRYNRVNAYVEKGTDGKWRVSNSFKIG